MDRNRTLILAGAGAAAGLLGAFGLLADEVLEGDTLDFDQAVLMWFRSPGAIDVPIGPAWLVEAARDVTALGSFSVLGLLVIAVCLQLALSHRVRTAAFLALAVVSGTVVNTVLKSVFDRPRPPLTGAVEVFTASFPSGHAMVSAVVYLTMGTILAATEQSLGLRVFHLLFAVLLTVLVGLSRVYLGVHYPTDVIAGWSLGLAWSLICFAVARAVNLWRTRATAGRA